MTRFSSSWCHWTVCFLAGFLFLCNQSTFAQQPTDKEATGKEATGKVKPGKAESPAPQAIRGEKGLKFNFRFTPWKDVIQWFAEQNDLSHANDVYPEGTFNYRDDSRTYTPAEALDVLNRVLLTKGYTLIRRERMLFLVPSSAEIHPALVPRVSLDQLDRRGEYELVSVLFQLKKMTPEEAEEEIQKLIGIQGKIVVLPKSRQILVTEGAGRVRTIRDIIKGIENPPANERNRMESFKLEHTTPDKAMAILRDLLDIPTDKNVAPDGSIRFAVDTDSKVILAIGRADKIERVKQILTLVDRDLMESFKLQHKTPDEALVILRNLLNLQTDSNVASDGSIRFAVDTVSNTLLVTGRTEKIQRVKQILKVVDVETPVNAIPAEMPQLEVYPVTEADPASVLQVMQTLLADEPDVRLASDPQTGSLIALARPSQHATIKATLAQMQKDGTRLEVIHLNVVDPQLAMLAINRLFGGGETEGKGGPSRAPIVEAEPISRQLLIRATELQITQIRLLLEKMGETEKLADDSSSRSKTRFIPLSGPAARTALEQLQDFWPKTGHTNKIRVIFPSRSIPTRRFSRPPLDLLNQPPAPKKPEGKSSPEKKNKPAQATPLSGTSDAQATRQPVAQGPRFIFVMQAPVPEAKKTVPEAEKKVPEAKKTEKKPEAEKTAKAKQKSSPDVKKESQSTLAPPEIIITVGPTGLVIASKDLDALDALEELLAKITSRDVSGGRQFTVFYLKYAKASIVAETIGQIFGQDASGSGGGGAGGGSLLGDLAGSVLGGNSGGGLIGSLLGLGGENSLSLGGGSIVIVPDDRLNALIVEANPTDLDTLEQLVKVIDQKASPEDVEVLAKPRIIPVLYTNVQEVFDIVSQVYKNRLSGASPQNRQPSPRDLIQLLRGGRGGRNTSKRREVSEAQKMTLGMDARTNSLIVVAPEPLYNEVKLLVEQLDHATAKSKQTTRIITLKHSNSQAVQQALSAMVGESLQVNRRSSGSGSTSRPSSGAGSSSSRSRSQRSSQDSIRRQLDFIRSLRSGMESSRSSSRSQTPGSSRGSSSSRSRTPSSSRGTGSSSQRRPGR